MFETGIHYGCGQPIPYTSIKLYSELLWRSFDFLSTMCEIFWRRLMAIQLWTNWAVSKPIWTYNQFKKAKSQLYPFVVSWDEWTKSNNTVKSMYQIISVVFLVFFKEARFLREARLCVVEEGNQNDCIRLDAMCSKNLGFVELHRHLPGLGRPEGLVVLWWFFVGNSQGWEILRIYLNIYISMYTVYIVYSTCILHCKWRAYLCYIIS